MKWRVYNNFEWSRKILYIKIKHIRMMKSQGSHIERDKLIKDGQKMGIDELVTKNERLTF